MELSKNIPTEKQLLKSTITNILYWPKRIDWVNVIFLIVLPAWAAYQALYTPLRINTLLLSVFFYSFTGISVTAGYHRLWSHSSYSASWPLRLTFALGGAAAFQHSIRWWATKHRAHHRFTDTSKDPYAAHLGFWHAHMGWLVFKQDQKIIGRVNVYDLDQDRIVMWQHKYLLPLQLLLGYALPISIAHYCWNDIRGGLIYASILRIFLAHQATFFVNSLAHYIGDKPFDDRHTPCDSLITALFTFGEGYHNFHHTFPNDFRNAIEWWQYDPCKWLIAGWKSAGLVWDLKSFQYGEIEKRRVQQARKMLDKRAGVLDWGVPIETLPVIEWSEFLRLAKEEGRSLVLIAGVVHDVEKFQDEHPGGKFFVKSAVGKDATAMFNGGVYSHSLTATNLLATMRVAVINGGGEVEALKE
ncbi:hypothetical protein D6D13_02006 [Aureobasidium pullulans]|uniref:Acyl-CoA desaturase n=1 Tax=Aureobasidium pullulans TaxID=5580 RepID=A0A4S9D995_AURPU|nr:hypothetical protein D6D13_02006 [Aureobasidium pullulans]